MCCCDTVDYELFPDYITLPERMKLERSLKDSTSSQFKTCGDIVKKIREVGGDDAFPNQGTQVEKEFVSLHMLMCYVMKKSYQEPVDKLKEWHRMIDAAGSSKPVMDEIVAWLEAHQDKETETLILNEIKKQHGREVAR